MSRIHQLVRNVLNDSSIRSAAHGDGYTKIAEYVNLVKQEMNR